MYKKVLFFTMVLAMLVSACTSALPLRSDMPLDGITEGVTYTRTGPAGDPMEKNESLLRGVNEGSPLLAQDTIFGRMEEVKTEDVLIDGKPILGMLKIQRDYGYSNFFEVEVGYFEGHDFEGNVICGAKIRHQFNRNIQQYIDKHLRDYDSIWYYSVPCDLSKNDKYNLRLNDASLIALVSNEVWQARLYWGSIFVNLGHSVTIVGGLPSRFPVGWWLHGDVPNSDNDAVGATNMMLNLIVDLSSSSQPWLEFNPNGPFNDATVIFSCGDADRYATWDRVLLNRQREYAVFYRPNRDVAWDWITIRPVYNVEWNDLNQIANNLTDSTNNPFSSRLNEEGLPKSANDNVVAELEKYGCMNCPNPTLEQLMFLDKDNNVLYTITFRAYVGASQTLVIYSNLLPAKGQIWSQAPATSVLPERPLLRDDKGKILPDDQQTYKNDQQWAEFFREATVWNWLKDNPYALGADLFTQFNVTDASEWAPIPCSDGGICGYTPVRWNLTGSYFFTGNTRKGWLIENLLGEVGQRTLGMSFASNRYQGSGLHFATGQSVFNREYFEGFKSPESIFLLDARAMQLPDYLAEAWAALHEK